MSDPQFAAALQIVLNKISDEPTILNRLSHDILRKIILTVGNLGESVPISGQRCKVSELLKALDKAVDDPEETIGIFKCSQCEHIEIWADVPAGMFGCENSSECGRVICRDCAEIDDGCCMGCSKKLNRD